ncbi:MAG: serine/threonine protein phosphatase [Bacteroidetes bacterium CG02_land_8_20_14_3_00_31_25]|nr:MAG: serine/threonine protein phosphatase [Bacteroidetes bacterium CG02_land_8_20_14_3_00_31_25]PIX36084.1 MAG: serine/threonine protein phosphatase [Bacteroidetes bacterium CG_4_8_14_3_um_filter_31_14]PIY02580.1 MAG: serine/threonine protein phosphatase [Bacteroidetes bacterium CG_4_10_14_3_um_filter_31_20]
MFGLTSKKNINSPKLNKYGRKLVISDIHGCINTFHALIEKINLQKNDNLFLIGDYVDRGTDSKGVVDYIIDLMETGYHIFPLLGNHEDDLLTLHKYDTPKLYKEHLKTNQPNNIISEDFKIETKYIKFFSSLQLYYELESFLIVHAGFSFRNKNPYSDKDSMLWIRDFIYDGKKAKGKTIIHGHTPEELKEIEISVKNKNKIICLDNGCVFANEKEEGFGSLLCLDLDNFQLYIQQNID